MINIWGVSLYLGSPASLLEKEALAGFLQETLRLELSPEKTRVTSLIDGFEFLGHRVRLRWDPRFGYTPRLEIPKAKLSDLRHRVKQLTKRNRVPLSLSRQLLDLNPILRGGGYFYRYCTNAKKPFVQLDWYVGDRLWRWMREKHPKAGARWLAQQRRRSTNGSRMVWQADQYEQFLMGRIPVRRYRRGWMGSPDYAKTPGEPDA